MSRKLADAGELARLREELESVEGVARAFVESDPVAVYLIGDSESRAPLEAPVRAVLARHGLGAADVRLEVSYPLEAQPHRRVRFESARIDQLRVGSSRAVVTLGWAGQRWEGVAEGGEGDAVEMRLAAVATLHALEQVVDGALTFKLVGVKGSRAFDAELVIVLVRCPEADARSFVGVALVPGDPVRSAALAVLNATNRLLGNFLHVPG